MVGSAQTLSEADRRTAAGWAAECAERVLPLFEREARSDGRPRDAIARARSFARGDLDTAAEIGRRFVAGRAAHAVSSSAAVAAARAAAQAAAVAHMGAHALGAAAYAVRAAGLAPDAPPDAIARELAWQCAQMDAAVMTALGKLPPAGGDPAGPLGPGLLTSGDLGAHIRTYQAYLADHASPTGTA